MRFKGGYNVLMQGRPAGKVEGLPEPDTLYLPLHSDRFQFSEICVEDGKQVHPGAMLAKDPGNYSVPLIAPRAGKVRLDSEKSQLILENITKEAEEPYHPDEDLEHIPPDMDSAGIKRYKMLMLGAWQFFHDAYTGALPDPFGTPQSVIVSTVRYEPFVARGNVQFHKRLKNFTRGIEHLQALLEYQTIYIALPDIKSEFTQEVRETLRGYASVKLVQIPTIYPYDNFAVLARALGLEQNDQSPVWALDPAGVLAVDRAMTLSKPSTIRIVSIGGPGVENPTHLRAIPGYPLKTIFEKHVTAPAYRAISGGVFTGRQIAPGQQGLDAECCGLTIVPESDRREFLSFTRPGGDRRSYSNCFTSALKKAAPERLTTLLRGERRPCICCNYCEEVCPVEIMPHLIHKYIYQDALEELEPIGINRCVKCGLCSYVCPSKIDLRKQIDDAQETLKREYIPEETAT